MTARCAGPVDLGKDALTQAKLEQLWITDRQRLLTCIRRHLALRDFYADRDAALEGGKP
ncbi:anaerobic dehydrogenase [Rhizobium sp. CBN3]|uniref:anaerobic dehydrogenase n=1 Tax=Rhizobium sp. CBN3 TaxID=3058045 RepID=UPI002672194C|nr:anaerobic dehydrogenase [Rhizobium sp. CBN3]MDO3431205.1 anaerobic dehydrogenase [Rhizobium sp. CBN3]